MAVMDLKVCPIHDFYPLKYTKVSSRRCRACYEDPLSVILPKSHHEYGKKQGYKCYVCGFYIHEECINTNIPCRHKHPLALKFAKKLVENSLSCCLCKTNTKALYYHCSRCSFCICIPCARNPLIFNYPKAHEHELHQIPIKLSFTCDACGLCSIDYPCICLQCCFVIHRECIYLPRVIYINRHDHRISHVSSLRLGRFICGLCLEPVNGEYGAYSCLVCSYDVHSKCATRDDIWDKKELEGVPEEEEEEKPYEVIDQNLIKHFSHDHNLMKVSTSSLRLDERCYACTIPLNSELGGYKCTECEFVLHDECANLPRKKRSMFLKEKLTLCSNGPGTVCSVCKRYFTGFSYTRRGSYDLTLDVRCAAISDPFKHESHPHWLLYDGELRTVRCDGCGLNRWPSLRCKGNDGCGGFILCFRCVTLPTLVRHRYDEHPLSLYYGEKNDVNISYWCGICEEEIKSRAWFYGCNACDTTLHTKCVFQNLIRSTTWFYSPILDDTDPPVYLLPNNRLSRPICFFCKKRCTDDLVLRDTNDTNNEFLCCYCGSEIYVYMPEVYCNIN